MDHYKQVSMTRTEHFVYAWKRIISLMKVTVALIIHSFAPRYFTTYYSDWLKNESTKN